MSAETSPSAGLTIPDDAVLDVIDLSYQGQQLSTAHAKAVLEWGAPRIVAAELERLVAETDWAWAVGGSLLARAAELRGDRKAVQQ